MRAWIDIDNPPQARYLLPVARRFELAGHDVLLTARAYGDTFAILRSEGAVFEAIGSSFALAKGAKSRTLAGSSNRSPACCAPRNGAAPNILTNCRIACRRVGIIMSYPLHDNPRSGATRR